MRAAHRLQPGAESRPGFEHINRYWDDSRGLWAAKILPGEYYVTRGDEAILTVLGSCVSACIRDPLAGVGGMNHFMLPERSTSAGDAWEGTGVNAAARYGTYAMEHLINDIMRGGGRRERLEVKVTGGGQILEHMTDIGARNVAFVRRYLEEEGLRVVSEDVGDRHPRKVLYFPATGQLFVKRLASLHNDTLVRRERAYRSALDETPVAGSVELF